MLVKKCDICKKEIKEGLIVIYQGGYFLQSMLCRVCGNPVNQFLKRKGLVPKTDNKNKIKTKNKIIIA